MAQGGCAKSHAGVFARSFSHLPAPPRWTEEAPHRQQGPGGKDSTANIRRNPYHHSSW